MLGASFLSYRPAVLTSLTVRLQMITGFFDKQHGCDGVTHIVRALCHLFKNLPFTRRLQTIQIVYKHFSICVILMMGHRDENDF